MSRRTPAVARRRGSIEVSRHAQPVWGGARAWAPPIECQSVVGHGRNARGASHPCLSATTSTRSAQTTRSRGLHMPQSPLGSPRSRSSAAQCLCCTLLSDDSLSHRRRLPSRRLTRLSCAAWHRVAQGRTATKSSSRQQPSLTSKSSVNPLNAALAAIGRHCGCGAISRLARRGGRGAVLFLSEAAELCIYQGAAAVGVQRSPHVTRWRETAEL